MHLSEKQVTSHYFYYASGMLGYQIFRLNKKAPFRAFLVITFSQRYNMPFVNFVFFNVVGKKAYRAIFILKTTNKQNNTLLKRVHS